MENQLENLRKTFDEKNETRNGILKQIKELEQDENVKKYIELTSSNKELYAELKELALAIRKETMLTCNHIWITSSCGYITRDAEHFCIKCGLDTSAVQINRENEWGYRFLNFEKRRLIEMMADTLKNKYYDNLTGIKTDIICDSDLAKAIYLGIIKANPNVTDKQVEYYLKAVLHNIRTKEVTEKVKMKRKQRLGLSSKFYKWNEEDVTER